jgi:NAD-dependent epimerase/dehydratase family protein
VVAASELHVVLGAAGGTGSAVVRELATRGLAVRAVTRGGVTGVPEGVERVMADVGTSVGARRACEGAAVVYHCAQPDYRKWRELFPPMTRAVGRLGSAVQPSPKQACVYGPGRARTQAKAGARRERRPAVPHRLGCS